VKLLAGTLTENCGSDRNIHREKIFDSFDFECSELKSFNSERSELNQFDFERSELKSFNSERSELKSFNSERSELKQLYLGYVKG
jgi:hypothetical protein